MEMQLLAYLQNRKHDSQVQFCTTRKQSIKSLILHYGHQKTVLVMAILTALWQVYFSAQVQYVPSLSIIK